MKTAKNKLTELQALISRMPFEILCMVALPELNLKWRDVSQAVRNCRLPMTSASVAKIICKYIGKEMTVEEIDDIVARLRLRMIVTQTRTWHVIDLLDPISDVPVNVLVRTLPSRVSHALRQVKSGKSVRPVVQTIKEGDLIYMSVQLVSATKEGAKLYVATPPGQPVALVSSVHSASLLKPIVQGLGYQSYEDASLNGPDPASLLRIHDQGYTDHPDHLVDIPEYCPMPVLSSTGVDYINRDYMEQYVRSILGPNPPLLTNLTVECSKPFFDEKLNKRIQLNKSVSLTVRLRSADVGGTLARWALRCALAPAAPLLQLLRRARCCRARLHHSDTE